MKMRFLAICAAASGLIWAGCSDQDQQVTGPKAGEPQVAQDRAAGPGQTLDQTTAKAMVDQLLKVKAIPEGVTVPEGVLEARQQGLQEAAARILAGENPSVPAGKIAVDQPDCWVSDFGTALGEWDDDSRYISLGFDFKFYGNTYNAIYVNSNGNMTFNGANYDWWHPNVPDGGNVLIAPLYGDFTPSGGWGPSDVYVNTIGTAPNRQFVATWHIVPEFCCAGGVNTFQAVLSEGSNEILFGYNGLSTDGINWAGDLTMDVGISSGAGSYINYASGGAIPALDGTHVRFAPTDANATDYTASNSCGCTTPPNLALSVSPNTLWPPDHRMVPVAAISASSNCNDAVSLSIDVTSNEPINGTGDGDTAPDWEIVDNGDGTASVSVRAERKGNGTGRQYTISVTATDGYGNTATSSGTVSVPHSQKKK